MSTVVENLDQEITSPGASWPLLTYDTAGQIDIGTMILFDFANPVCWPGGLAGTGAVGAGIAAGAKFVNLANEAAELSIDGSVMPTYDGAGGLVCATTAGLVAPVGSYDLAALSLPNFHSTVWFKTPAAPSASSYKLGCGFTTSSNSAHQYGVAGAFSSGTTLGITDGGSASFIQEALGIQMCLSKTLVKNGDGTYRRRVYFNNVLQTDANVTLSATTTPTGAFRVGKGTLGSLGVFEGANQRGIFDNCTVSSVDPEVKRAAEWAACHARFGL